MGLLSWLLGKQPTKEPPGLYVYLLEFRDGMVKVGISSKPHERIKQIHRASGRIVKRQFISHKTSKARQVERAFIRNYARFRVANTEFFRINYKTGTQFLRRHLR